MIERRSRRETPLTARERSRPDIAGTYLPLLTKLTQSPWFLNFRGIVKTRQPPFLH